MNEVNQAERKQMSATMLKKVKAMTKTQLVEQLLAMHNYAEGQKAANMIMLAKLQVLEAQLSQEAK